MGENGHGKKLICGVKGKEKLLVMHLKVLIGFCSYSNRMNGCNKGCKKENCLEKIEKYNITEHHTQCVRLY